MPYINNIVLIGPPEAGKTRILNQLTGFNQKPKGLVLGVKPVLMNYEEKNLQIKYSDCGQGTGSRQINLELLKASKICLVFDVTDEGWEGKLDTYLDSKSINLPSGVQLLLLGNKIDLLTQTQLIAVRSAAQEYATRKGAIFVEYSAENNTNGDVLISSLTTGLPVALSSSALSSSAILTREFFSSQTDIIPKSFLSDFTARFERGDLSIGDLKIVDVCTGGPPPSFKGVEPVVASRSTLSTALRYVGMALMVAALVNAIYLLLIAMNVFSAVALTVGMNHLLVTVGGLLGFAAPVTAFGNACAAIGLSTAAATGALSATGSLLMAAGIGYSMFRRNAPVRSLPPHDELTLSDRGNDGRTTPPLIERKY